MDFHRFTDDQLSVIFRIAKTRLRPWFADPHAMMSLRAVMSTRGLL